VRPDVAAILFDEPLTVIDPHMKWELRGKLKALHRRIDVTMIYVTHDQTEALTFADQVVVMNAGEVVQVGTPDQLFIRPEHVFVGHFIGSPGMNFLPCRLAGRSAIVGGHAVALGADYGTPAGRLELGIRPEFAMLAPPGAGVPVRVRRIEDLGRVRLARCSLADSSFVATVPDGFAPDGDAAGVVLPAEHLHLYADSRRVSPREPAREAA
jgi:glycerol transport system ATP-binding protein